MISACCGVISKHLDQAMIVFEEEILLLYILGRACLCQSFKQGHQGVYVLVDCLDGLVVLVCCAQGQGQGRGGRFKVEGKREKGRERKAFNVPE